MRATEFIVEGISEGLNESLSSLVAQDQSERNEYKNFVKSQAGGDWSKGAKMYAQLKKRPSNDIFGDAARLNQFMKMKFDFDKFTDEDWDNYWLLAQHCDDNRDFQKNALSIIKKYQGTDHSHYKYLYDRISMGLTGKQKYGTQNVKEQDVAEGEVVPLGKKHRGDLDSVNSCSKCGGKLEGGAYMGQRIKVCQPCKQVYLPPNSGIDQQGNKIKEQGMAEGLEQQYLWHGSRQKIPMLEPRQSVDTGGAAGSNQNAIYATSDPKVAIAMGLTTPGSDTGMFPNDPQMVLFSGKIRKGENVYLHKLPMNGPDGKPQFVQGGNSREFHSIPGVKGIKPAEIKVVPVDKYINLIRPATPQDLELRKKYMKQGVAEGLNELTNTSLKVKQPKDFVNTNDRKQVTWKVMKFKSGKDTYLINFTMQHPPAFGKKSKSNWNAVNVAFGVKEPQDEYSFGDEINTDLTARNKNQFLIYSTVINAIRKFITEYNTEIDEIIMQGAGERQEAMYQRFFQSAGKYFPGWHYDGKHSLVRDVPRQPIKKVREQGVAEGFSNDMSTEDMIAYLRQHHDTNLHQDYLNHLNTFSKFVLKDIPTNTLKTDLPGLDREKVERYKKMDQSKAPPIVLGGKYILDGYHRANAVKELGIPTIKAYVGVQGQQGVAEGIDDSANLSRLQSVQSGRTALGLVNLPVTPSNDNPNNTAKVVNTGDRIMAVLNVRGVNIPFYISTGGGGKASVPTGKWYPVFGIHSSGWLNKGTEESINKFYGSKELARGAEILNKYLGDLRSVEDKIPLMKPDGYSIINKNVKPMSWHEVDSNVTEFKKRINAVLVQIGDAPHYPEVEYSKNDKKSQIVHLQNLAKFYPNITMKDFINQGKEKIINDAMLEVNQLKNYYGQNKQANFVQLLSNLENDINSFKRGSLANNNNQNSVPNLSLLLKGTLGKINFSTP